MPMFFIDVHDGRDTVYDQVGIELADRQEAADEAAALLPDFAREALPDGQSHDVAAVVRDAAGEVTYRALLLFGGQSPTTRAVVNAEHLQASPVVMRSLELRREAITLQQRFAHTIPDRLKVLDQARESLVASRRARERRAE